MDFGELGLRAPGDLAIEQANGVYIPPDLVERMTSEVQRQQRVDPTLDPDMIERGRELRITAGQVSQRLKVMRLNEDE